MINETPRIDKVSVTGPATLRVKWKGKGMPVDVNLTGWIATGGETLAALKSKDTFGEATVGNYGSAVLWDDGDLAIDATHLMLLANEQKKFNKDDARKWQLTIGLSNNEVADLLDISLSTWNAYKAGTSTIPLTIAMMCRAILRDPLIMQAHLRPRKAGRPAA
jgi:hypothetical protein